MTEKTITKKDVDYINLLAKYDEAFFDDTIFDYISNLADRLINEIELNTVSVSFSSQILKNLLHYDNHSVISQMAYKKIPSLNEKIKKIAQLENVSDIIIDCIESESFLSVRNHIFKFVSLLSLEKRIYILNYFSLNNFNMFLEIKQYLLFDENEVDLFFSSLESISTFNKKFNESLSNSFNKNLFFTVFHFQTVPVLLYFLKKNDTASLKLSIPEYLIFVKDAIYYYNSELYLELLRIFDKEHLKNEIIKNNNKLDIQERFSYKQKKYNKIILETIGINDVILVNDNTQIGVFDFCMHDRNFLLELADYNNDQLLLVLSFIQSNKDLYFYSDNYCLTDEAYEIIELNFSF